MAANPCRLLILVLAFTGPMNRIQSANILGLFTSLSPSHLIIQMSTAKILAERGHNVTVVTVLKPLVTHKDINLIQVPLSSEDAQRHSEIIGSMSKNDNSNIIISLFGMLKRTGFMFRKMVNALKDPRVRDLYLNNGNKFDLVIAGYFMNEYQLGFARKVKAPIVLVALMPPNQMIGPLIGNPLEGSFLSADKDAGEKGQASSFRQRLTNFFYGQFFKLFNYLSERRNIDFYNELFADDPLIPPFQDMVKNVSLIFFASHGPSEGPIKPLVPAAIEIGGIHIKDKPDPLPKDLASFLGNATDGAILLSLGSNVKSSHVKPETVKKMFNVLSKLKQRVIWKWEDLDKTPGKSENILYSKWLPQDDVLAHPNTKLFINHAGKGGITEAAYHGKPMLALPIFGDQPGNAIAMVQKGFGLTQSLLTLEEQPFLEAIQDILTNPQYTEKVSSYSSLYRDRPITARESLIYWTEYVIRHHGAAHLQSPLVHMNSIAANNLDVYALIFVILGAIVLLIRLGFKFVIKSIASKPKTIKKHKKQ
ncbi:UDP-glycosyltransferase UGT5-like [Drosophila bipectinata]|uniref:UDP-glycosyltransferase UGT5-like n=1 Tax=Drosophila bipectinata TaxID=42026 RepID=UPI001C892278|nr:UDP-glycosyltransferase UGT5-like [Drosophila bipectinata]